MYLHYRGVVSRCRMGWTLGCLCLCLGCPNVNSEESATVGATVATTDPREWEDETEQGESSSRLSASNCESRRGGSHALSGGLRSAIHRRIRPHSRDIGQTRR